VLAFFADAITRNTSACRFGSPLALHSIEF
jgi:hypothetical protein